MNLSHFLKWEKYNDEFGQSKIIFGAGGMLELSEAIRDYHDSTRFPHMVNEIFLPIKYMFTKLCN